MIVLPDRVNRLLSITFHDRQFEQERRTAATERRQAVRKRTAVESGVIVLSGYPPPIPGCSFVAAARRSCRTIHVFGRLEKSGSETPGL